MCSHPIIYLNIAITMPSNSLLHWPHKMVKSASGVANFIGTRQTYCPYRRILWFTVTFLAKFDARISIK